MTRKLAGKVAVITGGTSGIGLAAARLFHEQGARVLVTGTSPRTLQTARAQLEGVAEVLSSEAGDGAQVRALFEHVKARYGRLDVLFLNAGIVRSGPLAALEEADFDEVFRVNVKGPWLALRAAMPLLARGGSVVLTTSMTNQLGRPGGSVYAASKAALRSLARTAAAELLEQGVRVNALSPGPTDSGIIAKGAGSAEAARLIEEQLAAQVPMRRLGRTEEIARAALFLATEDSSFMTGEELVVDGGITSL